MPVQVLPYVQSALEQLNPYIQQAASGISGALQNRAVNKRTQSILSQLENPELSQIQQATLSAQLPPQEASNFLNARKIQATENAQNAKIQATQQAAQQKQQQDAIAKGEQAKKTEAIYGTALSLVNDIGKAGKLQHIINPGDLAAKKQKLESLRPYFEGILKEQVSSGQLSNSRFEFIIDSLFGKDKSYAENIGALQGLAENLGLDVAKDFEYNPQKGFIEKTPDKPEENFTSSVEIGQSFDKLPNASKAGAGTIIQSKDGTLYESDGSGWKKKKK